MITSIIFLTHHLLSGKYASVRRHLRTSSSMFVLINTHHAGCMLETRSGPLRVLFLRACQCVHCRETLQFFFCHSSSHREITQHNVTVHGAAQQVALGF